MRTDRTLVIDTNLWISRLLLPRSFSSRTVDAALHWGVPLMSQATLSELSLVLGRSKFDRYVSRPERQQFLRLLGGIVRMVPVTQRLAVCRDPDDDKFLDLAVGGHASLILTGDEDLLVLHPFHDVQIVSPRQFAERFVREYKG